MFFFADCSVHFAFFLNSQSTVHVYRLEIQFKQYMCFENIYQLLRCNLFINAKKSSLFDKQYLGTSTFTTYQNYLLVKPFVVDYNLKVRFFHFRYYYLAIVITACPPVNIT